MKKIYLATNYSHSDPDVREQRFNIINKVASEIMYSGNIVFSPISHSHCIEKASGVIRPSGFWLNQDLPFLAFCDELWIYKQDGWESSTGLQAEISEAKRLSVPIAEISFSVIEERFFGYRAEKRAYEILETKYHE